MIEKGEALRTVLKHRSWARAALQGRLFLEKLVLNGPSLFGHDRKHLTL